MGGRVWESLSLLPPPLWMSAGGGGLGALGGRMLAQCCPSSSCINTTGPRSSALLTPITCNCQGRSPGELSICHDCAPALNSGGVSWEEPDGLKTEKRPV